MTAAAVAAAFMSSCGKKGPPLAPLIRVPAAVEDFLVRRIGGEVFIRLRVPAANLDKSTPADLSRVEVYGYTGSPGPNDNLVKRGTVLASIPIRPPAAAAAVEVEPPPAPGTYGQGETVTVVEALTPGVLEVVPPLKDEKASPVESDPRARMLLWTDVTDIPARIYTAVGVGRNGRRGAFAPRVTVPLVPPTSPPLDVKVSFNEQALTISWTLPPDARIAVQAPATGTVIPSKPRAPASQPTRYNVYVMQPAIAQAAVPGGQPVPAPATSVPVVPEPVNEKPIEGASYEDRRLEFGVERCYAVRAVDAYGPAQVEGEPSVPACVTPKDVFAPAAPRGLAAVSSGGAVSLIWEPNTEADLAGYHVLRGNAGDEKLQRITTELVTGTTYRDAAVTFGSRYVYAVVAFDRADPPNSSGPSNRVEETVR